MRFLRDLFGSRAGLVETAAQGDLDRVSALLHTSTPRSIEELGQALLIAAVNGHNEVVKLLVAARAPVDAEGKNGTTALMLSVLRGNADVVLTLLESGANVNAQNLLGETALTFAVTASGVDIVRGGGGSLEHYAPLREAIVKTLLAFGADPKPLLDDNTLDAESRLRLSKCLASA